MIKLIKQLAARQRGGRYVIDLCLILLLFLLFLACFLLKVNTRSDLLLVIVCGVVWFIIFLLMLVLRRLNYVESTADDWQTLAERDPLTNISNRRVLLNANLPLNKNARGAIIIIDIDDFKSINDNYGHNVGDEVLCSLASSLQNMIRKNDIVCRWGGDEFVVVLDNANLDGAVVFINRLKINIFPHDGSQHSSSLPVFSVTAGVALLGINSDIQTAIASADEQLLKNKQALINSNLPL